MNILTRGFHGANRLLWPRRWWLMIVPSLLVFVFFCFLPDSATDTSTVHHSLQTRLLLASFIGLLTALLVAFLVCLSHAIANRRLKWTAALVLFFPLTALPYLYVHRATQATGKPL